MLSWIAEKMHENCTPTLIQPSNFPTELQTVFDQATEGSVVED